MKTKTFLIAGITGGILNFFLGWLFYGILFKDIFPQPDESLKTMLFMFFGCLALGLFVSYIYTQWAQIATSKTGAKAGAIIGLFIGLFYNFFNLGMQPNAELTHAGLDVIISVIMTTIMGAAIGAINGKLKQ